MIPFLFLFSTSFALKIITRKFQPLSDCEGSGFEIELLKKSFSGHDGLSTEFEIICKNSVDEVMTALATADSETIGVGGLIINGEYIEEGFTYSTPTIRSGLNILTKKSSSNDHWWLIRIFDSTLWFLFLAIPFVIGTLNWTLGITVSNKSEESKSIETLVENIWQSYSFNFYNGTDTIRMSRFLNVLLGAASSLLLYAYISSYFSFDFDDAMSKI